MNAEEKEQHEKIVDEIISKHINNAFEELHKAGYRIGLKYNISINEYTQHRT